MKSNNPLKLIVAVAVSELAGVVGSVFTVASIPNWYAGLARPALKIEATAKQFPGVKQVRFLPEEFFQP